MLFSRDVIERRENVQPTLIQIFLDALASGALGEIAFGTILAGEKAGRERKIRNYANSFFHAQGLQCRLITRPLIEVVVWLETFVARKRILLACLESRRQTLGRVIGSADGPYFALLDQLGVRAQRLFERRFRIVLVRLVEVDVIGLQSPQRILDGAKDIRFRQPFLARTHLHPDLGRDDDLAPVVGPLHPVTDDGFRFSALVPGGPAGINVGGIDEIESSAGEAVEYGKRRLLISRPAEDVAAQAKRRNIEI